MPALPPLSTGDRGVAAGAGVGAGVGTGAGAAVEVEDVADGSASGGSMCLRGVSGDSGGRPPPLPPTTDPATGVVAIRRTTDTVGLEPGKGAG